LHGAGDFVVAHEPAPDIAGAKVFGAEKCDAKIDADDVGVNPTVVWIEGVYETVAIVNLISPTGMHGLERR
jgi:hypothetical protein